MHQLKIVKENIFFRISTMFQMKFPATLDILQLHNLALAWQRYSALLALPSYLPSRLLNQTVSLCFPCTTSVSPYLISPRLLPPNTSPRFSPWTAWLLLPPALSQAEWFFFSPPYSCRDLSSWHNLQIIQSLEERGFLPLRSCAKARAHGENLEVGIKGGI